MESVEVKDIIEALIFVSDHPVAMAKIKNILGKETEKHDIEQLIRDIGEEYKQRKSPVELRFLAGGWQFSTRKEFSNWIRKLYKEKTTLRLSASALETLSIVAYKQPITRSEIEEIRGVEVTGVLETILERKLVRIVGRKETVGRPLLYGTTVEFLRHFGLSHLSELPSLDELSPPEEAAEDDSEEEMDSETSEDANAQDVSQEDVSSENESEVEEESEASEEADAQDVSAEETASEDDSKEETESEASENELL